MMEVKPISLSELDIDDGSVVLTMEDIKSAAVEITEKKNKPLLVNYRPIKKTNHLVWGHKYVEAAKKLNIDELPCVTVKIDNYKENELFKKMNNKLIEFDYEEMVGQYWVDRTVTPEEVYTNIRNVLIYEPNGGYNPSLEECIDLEEYNRALADIRKMSGLTDEEKKIAELLATRFIKFNFSYIADRYVNSSKEARKMYERMLAVIIDTDNAIQYGFQKLVKGVFTHGYQSYSGK